MHRLTLGLCIHRPEMIPVMETWLRQHDAIVLEEPAIPGFHGMLNGDVAIEDYLLSLDVEYPDFSRRLCRVLREQHLKGKTILQIEPFLDALLDVHTFFADGGRPAEIPKNDLKYVVYLAEKKATKALLDYYRISLTGSFEETVEKVCTFARMDAARFRLRDSLRAQALVPLAGEYSSVFVEAGVIHYPLWRLLRRTLPSSVQARAVFLSDAALGTVGEKGRLYGPGDQLTLLYVFHPDTVQTRRERTLAARSIIYSKIIRKEEITADLDDFPHLRDELTCIRITGQLSFADCRSLFPRIRRLTSGQAREMAADFAAAKQDENQSERGKGGAI